MNIELFNSQPSEVSLTQSTSASAVPTSLPCEGTTSLSLHLQLSSSAGGVSSPSGQLVKPTMANTSKQTVMSPAAKVLAAEREREREGEGERERERERGRE